MRLDIKSVKDFKIGFIGAGKVGFSLGKLFSENLIRVTGYYSRHAESAKEASLFTKSLFYENLESIVNDSNVLFLTVPDGEIKAVFNKIRILNISEKIVVHTSGALSSKEAFALEDNNIYGYSVHPLFPVSSKEESYKELRDAFFCIEGHEKYLELINSLIIQTGARTKIISSENKIKYHAACAISSNLVCGLINESISLLLSCGFSEEEALKSLAPLIKSNINHITADGLINSLTGPVERNDVTTVSKHIQSFDTNDEILLYKAVSLKVLDIAKKKHIDRDYSELSKILKIN